MRPLFFSFLSVLLCFSVNAQTRYYPDNSVRVFAGGIDQTLAWSGGYNNPQFSTGDLNNDGLADLVIYEPNKGVKTFINKGSAGNPDYRYVQEYEANFPPCYDYMILADYNCDNIPDLFQQGSTGFSVYKGYYNSRNQLCFKFYQDLYYTNDPFAGGAANAFNNPGDIPAIVDVDHDGDLDFISYNILGGYMNLYKNERVEMGLPCDSIHIKLKDRCWGKVYQGFYRTHTLASSCNNSGLKSAGKKTHSGNTPCLFDWDMDGDYDYLDGSVSYDEMTFLKNGRIEYGGPDSMISQDTMWQTGGKQVSIPVWPAAFNVDVDQDGKKDLLIAPNAGSGSENYKCIWYYKNFSTAGSPDWRFQSDSFLTDKTIDVGTGSYPMLFDYNKDGKPDLFIGSDGYHQSSGLLRSRISYYMNTTTAGDASFTLVTKDFLQIDTFGFEGTAPAFGDIDNDGKADMVIGHTDGSLSYFKNLAASNSVQPIWSPVQVTLTDITGAAINVDGRAAPFIYDIDKDGKQDIVIGNIYGTLNYYQNVSTTPGNIRLKFISSNLGNVKVDPDQVAGCYSTPFIGKIDNSGKDYLLVGSNSGNLYLFDSVQSGDTTITYPLKDAHYSYIDTNCNGYNNPGSFWGAYYGLRSAPVVGDIAGDGGLEMLVGDIRGGTNLYKRKAHDDTRISFQGEQGHVQIYPNPANEELNLTLSGMVGQYVQISILNMQGQSIFSIQVPISQSHVLIPVGALSSGIYVCFVQSQTTKYYNKFTVIK